jgi:hemerythrin
MKWISEYSVGHPLIDKQHRQLLALCEEIDDAGSDDAFHELLDRITRSTNEHFQTEESLLEPLVFPDREAHIAAHTALLEGLADVIFEAIEGDLDRSGLREFLENWYSDHMLAEDGKFAPYFQRAATKVESD